MDMFDGKEYIYAVYEEKSFLRRPRSSTSRSRP